MALDFIPPTDGDFNNWQRQFTSYLNSNLAALGLDPLDPDVAALAAAAGEWEAKFPAHLSLHAQAKGARLDKDGARASQTEIIRRLARRLQGTPAVGDDERANLGLTRRDRTRTRIQEPQSAPILSVDFSERLRITVRARDTASPDTRARPLGTMGCELWIKIGDDLPGGIDDCRFLAIATRPYIASFDAEQVGQRAHFIARWINRRGERGPMSATTSATIPG